METIATVEGRMKMIKVTDNRLGPEVNLCEIEVGGTFIWNEYPCMRLDYGQYKFEPFKEDTMPCMLLASGQYCEISRTAWVTPIRCELLIME